MLKDLGIKYNNFYKTISKDNYASIKVAENSGFVLKSDSLKTRLMHTINVTDNGTQYLYVSAKDIKGCIENIEN